MACEPQPEGIALPALRLFLAEAATPADVLRARRLERRRGAAGPLPAARPRPVMLLPGFFTHPARMGGLRRALARAGHRVSDWGQGWNMGASAEGLEALCDRIEATAAREGAPVVLVGWSLGGLYAREAAKRVPHAVAMVVTMGSPFSGSRRANRAWRAYHLVAGHAVERPPIEGDLAEKPPVTTIALWSPRDGIVSRRAACGRPGERDVALAVRCTHLGFAAHPAVATTIADLLERH